MCQQRNILNAITYIDQMQGCDIDVAITEISVAVNFYSRLPQVFGDSAFPLHVFVNSLLMNAIALVTRAYTPGLPALPYPQPQDTTPTTVICPSILYVTGP